jgi:hypothetical protein
MWLTDPARHDSCRRSHSGISPTDFGGSFRQDEFDVRTAAIRRISWRFREFDHRLKNVNASAYSAA